MSTDQSVFITAIWWVVVATVSKGHYLKHFRKVCLNILYISDPLSPFISSFPFTKNIFQYHHSDPATSVSSEHPNSWTPPQSDHDSPFHPEAKSLLSKITFLNPNGIICFLYPFILYPQSKPIPVPSPLILKMTQIHFPPSLKNPSLNQTNVSFDTMTIPYPISPYLSSHIHILIQPPFHIHIPILYPSYAILQMSVFLTKPLISVSNILNPTSISPSSTLPMPSYKCQFSKPLISVSHILNPPSF